MPMFISKFKLIGIGAILIVALGASGYIVTRMYNMNSEIHSLSEANTKLASDNLMITENLATEKRLREDTEKVLSHFKDLVVENKETDNTNTVVVEKIKQIDVKTVSSDTINRLTIELEDGWKCLNQQSCK